MRVVIREVVPSAQQQPAAYYQDLHEGETVTVGREADLGLGVAAKDANVSRVAVAVTATGGGWTVECLNRHGAFLHLWGQAPRPLEQGETVLRAWPRAGIRVIGGDAHLEHWVLIEADEFERPGTGTSLSTTAGRRMAVVAPPAADDLGDDVHDPGDAATAIGASKAAPRVPGVTTTTSPRPPKLLTAEQRRALTAVFAEHLAWPPIAGPQTVALDRVARHLPERISESAVRERLKTVQGKAERLGGRLSGSVTDPDYLYVLVHHDYVPSSTLHVDALRYR